MGCPSERASFPLRRLREPALAGSSTQLQEARELMRELLKTWLDQTQQGNDDLKEKCHQLEQQAGRNHFCCQSALQSALELLRGRAPIHPEAQMVQGAMPQHLDRHANPEHNADPFAAEQQPIGSGVSQSSPLIEHPHLPGFRNQNLPGFCQDFCRQGWRELKEFITDQIRGKIDAFWRTLNFLHRRRLLPVLLLMFVWIFSLAAWVTPNQPMFLLLDSMADMTALLERISQTAENHPDDFAQVDALVNAVQHMMTLILEQSNF